MQPVQLIAASNTFRETQRAWTAPWSLIQHWVQELSCTLRLSDSYPAATAETWQLPHFPAQRWPRWGLYILHIQLLGWRMLCQSASGFLASAWSHLAFLWKFLLWDSHRNIKIQRALLLVSFWTWWVQEKNLKLTQIRKPFPKMKPMLNCESQIPYQGDLSWFAAWLTCEHQGVQLVSQPHREHSAVPILTRTAKATHQRCLWGRDEASRPCITTFSCHCWLFIYALFSAAPLCNLWWCITSGGGLSSIFVSTPGILRPPGFAVNKSKATN